MSRFLTPWSFRLVSSQSEGTQNVPIQMQNVLEIVVEYNLS